jgi:dTDP-4-dehydrorhamnose 3,5-epimerase
MGEVPGRLGAPRARRELVNVEKTRLDGLVVTELARFDDERGHLVEIWNSERYAAWGIDVVFQQDSLSSSRRSALRGLHAQNPRAQAKLITCLAGEIWDVSVDLRLDSPTFGQWRAEVLSAENRRQLFIPVGFAHGFVVLSDAATVHYKCSDVYAPDAELSIAWNDPDLAIPWPVSSPLLSPRDANARRLRDVPRERLFTLASSVSR